MKPIFALCLAAAPALALAGPYDQPYSIIETDPIRAADPLVIPVIVNRVDDSNALTSEKAVVAPGPHRVVLDVPPRRGFTATQQRFDLTTEPCMRYYVSARLNNRITKDWEPVVREKEPIGECKTKFALK